MSGIRCRSIIKNATTAWCSKRHVKQRNTHIVVFGTHRDRHFGSYPFHKNSYHGYLTMTSLSTASSLSYASYFTTIKKRFATQNTNDGNDNDNDNSVIASKEFSHLENPIADDAENFLLLMDSRPGSLLTTFKTMSINNDDDDDDDDDNDDTTTHNDDDDEDYRETPSLEKYNVDWTGHYRGSSSIVVRPKSTKEVSRILSYCHKRRIGVVPQGGNTGLVGGSVGIGGEVILSLEKMNNFECYDKKDGSIIRADAGCILEDLQNYAAKNGNLVPVDLGAKGSCQIGGNVSTNAGGVYYYRYGSLHANVLGLEVVTPTGDVLNLGYDPVSHLKDNTGYHLKHLFIGGEGTLGVVTKVSLQCPPLPVSRGAMWLTCTSLSDVVRVLTLARTDHLNEILAAFEFMDRDVLELVRAAYPSIRFPLDIGNVTPATTINNDNIIDPYSILIETHGSDNNHDREKLESFFESIMEEGLVVDGVMAQNLGQIEDFWKIRELCNPATAATGYVYKYDISLAASDFDSFIHDMKVRLIDQQKAASSDENLICGNWGHIIDGNLHCNIVSPNKFERDIDLLKIIDEGIFEEVMKRNGSISAEHGLGQYKNEYMTRIKNPSTLRAMYDIKRLFDPHGIMNPGKYLPQPSAKSSPE